MTCDHNYDHFSIEVGFNGFNMANHSSNEKPSRSRSLLRWSWSRSLVIVKWSRVK